MPSSANGIAGVLPTPAQIPPERRSQSEPNIIFRNPAMELLECLYGEDQEYETIENDEPVLTVPDYQTLQHEIDLPALRKLASQGIPDDASQRSIVWRLLLGYLPLHVQEWQSTVDRQRDLYLNFCRDFFHSTFDVDHGHELQKRSPSTRRPPKKLDLPMSLVRQWKKIGKDVHVLEDVTKGWNALKLTEPTKLIDNNPENPDWSDFIARAALLDEIRKDVVRTHPDLSFFLVPTLGPRRYAALERMLFVWATINKGVRYVQGMNELASVLYYVVANDTNDWAAYAEGDAYWMLSILLAEMRDVFISDMDDADTGIQGRMTNLNQLLLRHDPQVQEHLQELGIDVSFYAIRWWTTLLSREFLLPDTIRLWDSLLASSHKDNFLRYVCVTMILLIRDNLLEGDFSTCLRYLHSYPPCHMDYLLESTKSLWIYESQILLACQAGIPLHQALSSLQPPLAIIMAFGLRKGIAPKTRSEQLEEASEKAAAKVEELTTAMAASASGWLGRANRFYQRKVDKYKVTRSRSADDVRSSPTNTSASLSASKSMVEREIIEVTEDIEDDEVYLSAILNA